jgi:hypothetical protein
MAEPRDVPSSDKLPLGTLIEACGPPHEKVTIPLAAAPITLAKFKQEENKQKRKELIKKIKQITKEREAKAGEVFALEL